jgi:hypothetical protein
MESLKDLLKNVLDDRYAGGGFNLTSYLVANDEANAYAVLVVDSSAPKHEADIIVFARIMGEYIIIEADNTDRPLGDFLVAHGIPREKIICAHWGESLPDSKAAS